MLNIVQIKDRLLLRDNADTESVGKFIAYLNDELTKPKSAVHRNTDANLINLYVKYYNAGLTIDGRNVVVTGQNMALIQYFGYINKVKQVHPDVFFDVQIVREGEEFDFSKKNGKVEYTHKFGNPFSTLKDKPIIGAYCVVRLSDGKESIEFLTPDQYNDMKKGSKSSYTWDAWPTEFWRKSVIKRACKLYFNEEVEKLEEIDNADYGLAEETLEDIADNVTIVE